MCVLYFSQTLAIGALSSAVSAGWICMPTAVKHLLAVHTYGLQSWNRARLLFILNGTWR